MNYWSILIGPTEVWHDQNSWRVWRSASRMSPLQNAERQMMTDTISIEYGTYPSSTHSYRQSRKSMKCIPSWPMSWVLIQWTCVEDLMNSVSSLIEIIDVSRLGSDWHKRHLWWRKKIAPRKKRSFSDIRSPFIELVIRILLQEMSRILIIDFRKQLICIDDWGVKQNLKVA